MGEWTDIERRILYEYRHPHHGVWRGIDAGVGCGMCGDLDGKIAYGPTLAQDRGLGCRSGREVVGPFV